MPKITNIKRPSEVMFLTEENYWSMCSKNMLPTLNYHVRNGNGDLNLSFCGLNDMFFMPDRTGSTIQESNGDCIATFHKATDSILCNGVSSVLFNDGHVGAEKAYDSTTTTNSVRRSWQLATGKQ
jgi:hypothetical protein